MADKGQEQRIRECAYLIWIAEGEPEGLDKVHWEKAKAQIEEEDRKRSEIEQRGVKPSSGPSFGP